MKEFVYTPEFLDSLKNLPKEIQQKIKEKLLFLSQLENPLTRSKKIKGEKNIFRFRAGDYRILFETQKNTIILHLTDHRKNIYQNL